MNHWWGLLHDSLSHVYPRALYERQESLAWKHLLESIINHCLFKICDFCIYCSNVIVHMCWSLEGTYIHALVIGKYGGSRLWWRVVFFFSSYFRNACVFVFQTNLACLICGYAGGLQSNLINTVDSTAGFIEIDMITQNLQIIKKYEYI